MSEMTLSYISQTYLEHFISSYVYIKIWTKEFKAKVVFIG